MSINDMSLPGEKRALLMLNITLKIKVNNRHRQGNVTLVQCDVCANPLHWNEIPTVSERNEEKKKIVCFMHGTAIA